MEASSVLTPAVQRLDPGVVVATLVSPLLSAVRVHQGMSVHSHRNVRVASFMGVLWAHDMLLCYCYVGTWCMNVI